MTEHDIRDETIFQLRQEIEHRKNENLVFHKFFTPNQINKLMNPKKEQHGQLKILQEELLSILQVLEPTGFF